MQGSGGNEDKKVSLEKASNMSKISVDDDAVRLVAKKAIRQNVVKRSGSGSGTSAEERERRKLMSPLPTHNAHGEAIYPETWTSFINGMKGDFSVVYDTGATMFQNAFSYFSAQEEDMRNNM